MVLGVIVKGEGLGMKETLRNSKSSEIYVEAYKL